MKNKVSNLFLKRGTKYTKYQFEFQGIPENRVSKAHVQLRWISLDRGRARLTKFKIFIDTVKNYRKLYFVEYFEMTRNIFQGNENNN